MKTLLVSACLLGTPCRYDGKSKVCEKAVALREKYTLVSVCPEVLGGLSTPRPPCEIQGKKAVTADGKDCTAQYTLGAEKALQLCKENSCVAALLKEKSPSCGKGRIHNGKFDGGLTEGNGICAALLQQNGIPVFGESEIDKLSKLS